MSKCRGKGRTRGNCVCENLDDWEVVPPLTTREHRKGCTVGRSNVEFDLGYTEFEILAECLCEQPGTYGNVGMELGKELRPRDFMQIWKSSLRRLKPPEEISFLGESLDVQRGEGREHILLDILSFKE